MLSSPTPNGTFRAKVFTCCSVAANAICAGGIFTFPLLSPVLVTRLRLTQPQLSTIVLAGMAGQYPLSSIVGKMTDLYGPGACSLAASVLFSGAFGLSSWVISNTPDDITEPSVASFRLLTIAFAVAGLATVSSYFSSLFAASRTFPELLGVASGTTMAIFGLSPLVLSLIATSFFTESATHSLNAVHFLTFMAILTGVVHFLGAFNLGFRSYASHEHEHPPSSADETPITAEDEENENTALLPRKPNHGVSGTGSSLDLLRDPYFWVLGILLLITLGICEMIMSNLGTLVLSLPSSTTVLRDNTSTQVRVLSIANTLSRLILGSFADFTSPAVSNPPPGDSLKKHHVSRIAFLFGAGLLLSSVSFWMIVGVRTQEGLCILSISTGIAYGTIFSVLPSIVSSVWGMTNLARNFGIITYAPFIGTTVYTYLYAFVASANTDQGLCQGQRCWQPTFWVCTGSSLFATFCSIVLWRQWKGRL